jgi:hypothetical protein
VPSAKDARTSIHRDVGVPRAGVWARHRLPSGSAPRDLPSGPLGQAPVYPPFQGRRAEVSHSSGSGREAAEWTFDADRRRSRGTGDDTECVQELAGGRLTAAGQSKGEVYPAPGAPGAAARPPLPRIAGAERSHRLASQTTQRGTAASEAAGPCGEETMSVTEPDGLGSGRRRVTETLRLSGRDAESMPRCRPPRDFVQRRIPKTDPEVSSSTHGATRDGMPAVHARPREAGT